MLGKKNAHILLLLFLFQIRFECILTGAFDLFILFYYYIYYIEFLDYELSGLTTDRRNANETG